MKSLSLEPIMMDSSVQIQEKVQLISQGAYAACCTTIDAKVEEKARLVTGRFEFQRRLQNI